DKNLDDSNNNDQLDNEEEEDRDSEGKYRLLRALGYNVGFYGMKLIRRIRKRLPSKESAESELSVSIPHEKISKEAEIIFDGLDPLTRKVYIQDYKHDGGEDEGVNEYDYDAMDDSAGMPEVFDFSGRDPGVLSKFMQDQIEELYNNPNPRSGRVIALVEEKLGGRALYFDPLQQKWLEVEGGYSDHQPIPYHPDSLADSKAREAIVDTEVRAANSRAERSGSELGRSIWQKGWEGLRSWKDSRKLNKIARNQLLDQAKEGGLRFSPDPSSRFGLDKDGRSFLGQLNALVRRGGAIIRGQEEVIQIPRGSTYADILKLINNGASPDDVQDSKGLVTPTNKESQDIEMPYTEEDIKLDPNVFSQRGLCTPEAQWDIVDDQGVILYRFGRSDLDQLSLDIAKANNSILDSSSMQQAIARGMVEAIRNILEAKEVQIGTHVKVRIYNKM
ncbi:hypothetical protein KC853_03100, partial [Candidatus Saccharibacteria bacterium]|nr:hypothetical protein [Candidatus Saccharibacteria bacterium]